MEKKRSIRAEQASHFFRFRWNTLWALLSIYMYTVPQYFYVLAVLNEISNPTHKRGAIVLVKLITSQGGIRFKVQSPLIKGKHLQIWFRSIQGLRRTNMTTDGRRDIQDNNEFFIYMYADTQNHMKSTWNCFHVISRSYFLKEVTKELFLI